MKLIRLFGIMLLLILVMVYLQRPHVNIEKPNIKIEVVAESDIPSEILNDIENLKAGQRVAITCGETTYAVVKSFVGEHLSMRSVKESEEFEGAQEVAYKAMFIDETIDANILVVKLSPYRGEVVFKLLE